jgi:hypothetical protein
MNLREQTNPLAVARERPTRARENNAKGSVVRDFRAAADAAYDALKSGWSRKTAQIFMSSLATHAYPVLGDIPVNAVTAADIADVLTPIWTSKPSTARKVRERIGAVLNFAHRQGWRSEEAPGGAINVSPPLARAYDGNPKLTRGERSREHSCGQEAIARLPCSVNIPSNCRQASWGDLTLPLLVTPGSWKKERR